MSIIAIRTPRGKRAKSSSIRPGGNGVVDLFAAVVVVAAADDGSAVVVVVVFVDNVAILWYYVTCLSQWWGSWATGLERGGVGMWGCWVLFLYVVIAVDNGNVCWGYRCGVNCQMF